MKVSVIIPTYNEEKVIKSCLLSLSDQKYKDFEVIVVDDGSKDKTVEIVSQFKTSALKLRILTQKHMGPGVARNLGAKHAKGEILVFVDADMTFDKIFIQRLVLPILEGKTKGTFSKEEYVSNWNKVWARCWSINENWLKRRRHPKDYPDTQEVFRAITKKEFQRVDGFEKGGYTDDMSLAKKLNYKAIAVSKARFYHKNPESLGEVFKHARWVGKRKYKFGYLGYLAALFRSFIIFSVMVGIYKSIRYKEPAFVIFKIIYDLGITIGVLQYMITRSGAK
jgi:glycosyltransferase involved in cell wall biosynthesis